MRELMKTAEQKAFKEYPLPKEETESTSFINQETFNSAKRTGYIIGYNQAMKDLLKKAMKYLRKNLLVSDLEHRKYLCMTEKNKDNFIRDFKNYMKDE